MNQPLRQAKFDWGFWILWVAATAISLSIALLVRQWLVGLIVGLAQWLVLWNRYPKAGWWIVVTALGYGISWSPAWNLAITIIDAERSSWRYAIEWPIVLGVSAAIGGIFQWSLLRRWVYRAGWWILTGLIGGIAGGAVGMIVFDLIFRNIDSPAMVWLLPAFTGVAAGIVFGAITGAVLVWLGNHPINLPSTGKNPKNAT
jgi:hypothetical protein